MTRMHTILLVLGAVVLAPAALRIPAAAVKLPCKWCHHNCCQWAWAKYLIHRGWGEVSGADALVDYHWQRYRDPMPCTDKRLNTRGYSRCAWTAYKACGRRHCKCFGFNSVMGYTPLFQPSPARRARPRLQSESVDLDISLFAKRKALAGRSAPFQSDSARKPRTHFQLAFPNVRISLFPNQKEESP